MDAVRVFELVLAETAGVVGTAAAAVAFALATLASSSALILSRAFRADSNES